LSTRALPAGVHRGADESADVHDAEQHANDAQEETQLGDDVAGVMANICAGVAMPIWK
jgi:hypothetical protein